MAKDLTNRLITLGRVHDLVRPVPGQEKRAVLMADLLTILLSPYDGIGDSRRIRVASPKINVGEAASTSLALVVHELATNSAKYGALSVAAGLLDVTCAEDEAEVILVWTERGGPAVAAPDKPPGYGSRMIASTLSAQLGGSIDMNWSREGVIATLRLNKHRLVVPRRPTMLVPGKWVTLTAAGSRAALSSASRECTAWVRTARRSPSRLRSACIFPRSQR